MQHSSTPPIQTRPAPPARTSHPRRAPSETPYFAYVILAALLVIATAAATGLAAATY